MVELREKSIVLDKFPNFSAADTLECGQIFRYSAVAPDTYSVHSADKYAEIVTDGEKITVNTDDPQYFYRFFDLETDYSAAAKRLSDKNEILKKAAEYGKGIRILNQNVAEMIFSFIISANNNIKRIQLIIGRLCDALGEKTAYGRAFPSVEAMAEKNEDFYAGIGAGYRARYLAETAARLKNYSLSSLQSMPTEEARKELLSFCGIGPKVADCILLFALKRGDVFPVDTWIKKVYHEYFEAGHKDSEIASYFTGLFKEDSGLCQQYLFYYRRKYGQNK